MSILIGFVTFILCTSLLAFGGFQTVQQSDFEQIKKDFEVAIETEPELPEDTDSEQTGDSADGGDSDSSDNGGSSQQPGGSDNSGNEKPGDSSNSDDNQKPGDSGNSDDNQKPEDSDSSDDDQAPDSDLGGDDTADGNSGASTAPALSTTETKDAFKDLYNNHDPNFKDIKKDVLSNMITGILKTESDDDVDDEEDDGTGFDDDFSTDFSTDFDPDTYIPPEASDDAEKEDDVDEMVSDVVNIYFDKLINEIEVKQQENADNPNGDAEGEAFVEKEAEALAGLVNIVDNAQSGEAPEDEKILQSVDAILESTVCMDTVGSSVDTNATFTNKVQEATQDMNADTKSEIQSKIETSLEEYRSAGDSDPAKEKQYYDLANLFGITLSDASSFNAQ